MGWKSIQTLIVEDDLGTLRTLERIVQERDHDVEAVEDAEVAWGAFQTEVFDLVLLDMRLPGMDGLELCRRIRREPGTEDCMILFVTGVREREALEEALDAGADDYLEKPLDPAALHVRLAIAERRIREARERRRMEEELVRDALHDPLTGLPNRSLFIERLDRTARRESRNPDYLFSVLYLNLDRFKEVNREVGRDEGDRILKKVGHRLERCVRTVDTVARLGGDEYAILLDGLNDLSDPTRVVQRIQHALSTPVRAREDEVLISACIGISLSLTGYDRPEDVVRDAGKALKMAKEEGRGSHRMFDPVLHARAAARVQLESRIQSALQKREFSLEYQPIVSLEDEGVMGFEALLRWIDPERGRVPTEDFIPVAEETGIIVPLGWWALEEACGRIRGWRDEFPRDHGLVVSVNLSGRQFGQDDAVERIEGVLRATGLPRESVRLEVSENALMSNAKASERNLRRLKEASVGIYVDDFGTGYSSLTYLCRFPIGAVKVARSLVSSMTSHPEYLEIVRTIIRLSRSLGFSVIAEGVETEKQVQSLRELGCDYAQGNFFSPPLPAEAVPPYLSP